MLTAPALLDAAKTKQGCTDSELARLIGTDRQRIYRMKTKGEAMPDHAVIDLATLAGIDPAQALAEIRASEARPEVAAVWAQIAQRAAVAGLAAVTLLGQSPIAKGTVTTPENSRPSLYIMSPRRNRWGQRKPSRLWGWLRATDPLPAVA